jgi:macrolide transport system ATP-binding/permease protein
MKSFQILKIDHVHRTYGDRIVLADISLTVSQGDRIALVGENGGGKTTLARIITGAEPPDSGSIHLTTGASLAYLPQSVAEGPNDTRRVDAVVRAAAGDLERMRQRLGALEKAMAGASGDADLQALLAEYGPLQEAYQRLGGYDFDARLGAILGGLGVDHIAPSRAIGTLSGGEKTRVLLAALLLRAPDLLVLDEPTNHLDFAGLAWLESYLAGYAGALLLISHDRAFINATANRVAELSPLTHGLAVYAGDYDAYVAQREQAQAQALAAYDAQREAMGQIKRTLKATVYSSRTSYPSSGDKFYDGFKKGRDDSLKSRTIRDAKQRLATLEAERLANPSRNWRVAYAFDPAPLTSQTPLKLTGVTFGYGATALLREVTLEVGRDERVAIVAPNGAGKTTLLALLLGAITPWAGERMAAPGVIVGYLPQEDDESRDETPALDAYGAVAGGSQKERMTGLHRAGLFTDRNLLVARVCDLSTGQRRKLNLARTVAMKANVLLLDEPTNHLDLLSVEALEEALLAFDGPVVAVTHDRRFIARVATTIWRIEDGRVRVERA